MSKLPVPSAVDIQKYRSGSSQTAEGLPIPTPEEQVRYSELPVPPQSQAASISPEYAEVRKTIDRPFLDAPLVSTEVTTDRELEAIAKQHGVSPEVVKEMSTFIGAIREGGKGSTWEEFQSSLGRGVGFNIPQFIAKKSMDDPALRAVFDDIQDLADAKRSMARGLVENIIPVGAASKLVASGAKGVARVAGKEAAETVAEEVGQKVAESATKRVAKGAIEGTTMGGVGGLARSREGEELSSTGQGMALGGALGAGASLVGEGVGALRRRRATKAELNLEKEGGVDISKEMDEVAQKTTSSEKAIEEAVLTNRPLTADEADAILKEQVSPEKLQKYTDELSDENKLYKQQLEQYETDTSNIRNEFSDIEDGYRQAREVIQKSPDPIPLKGKLNDNIGQVRKYTATVRELSSKLDEAYANPKARGKSYTKQLETELFANQEYLSKLLDEQETIRIAIPQAIKSERTKQKMLPLLESLDEQATKLQNSLNKLKAPHKSEVSVDTIKLGLVNDVIETRTMEYARDLSGIAPRNINEARELITKAQVEGGHNISRYREWLRGIQGEQAAHLKGIRAPDQASWFGKALNALSDPQFVFRGFDRKLGTKLEEVLAAGNRALGRMTYPLEKFRKQRENLFKQARKTGVDAAIKDKRYIYDAIRSGNYSKLTPAEKEIAEGFKKYWQDDIDFKNALIKENDPDIASMNIPRRPNYVPEMPVDTVEALRRIAKQERDVLNELRLKTGKQYNSFNDVTPEEWATLKVDPRVSELNDAVLMYTKHMPESALDLANSLEKLTKGREGNTIMETFARSAQERTGKIPEFLLETNLYKLANKSTINSLRHLYLRPTVDKLRSTVRVLEAMGADVEATYVKNLLQDVIGVRTGTASEALLRARIGIQRKLDEKIEKAAGNQFRVGYYKALQALPSIMETMSRNIYPNVLGYWSLRAAVQNMTSAITKVAPELGGPYGVLTTLRGAGYTLKNYSKLIARAKAMGTVPEEFARGSERAIAEGIQRTALWRIPADALQGMAHASMGLYKLAENINRALVLGMGDVMASQYTRKSPAAIKSINRFPPFVRKQIAAANGNEKKIADILGGYLNDVTQYNYNKLSLSEFGRSMGPIFSVFSKWPTATAGDVIEELRAKGALKGTQRTMMKYLMPMVLLQTIDAALGESTSFDITEGELSDTQKRIFGAKGLSQSAPLGSLQSITTGEMFTPPMVDALIQGIIVPIWKGDISQMGKAGQQAVGNFLPGMGMIRFLTDDLVTYLEGERPEGGFIERAIEGAETLGRKL